MRGTQRYVRIDHVAYIIISAHVIKHTNRTRRRFSFVSRQQRVHARYSMDVSPAAFVALRDEYGRGAISYV